LRSEKSYGRGNFIRRRARDTNSRNRRFAHIVDTDVDVTRLNNAAALSI